MDQVVLVDAKPMFYLRFYVTSWSPAGARDRHARRPRSRSRSSSRSRASQADRAHKTLDPLAGIGTGLTVTL
jgi:hypothetical protein